MLENLPDVLGWELPKALDEFKALGIPVTTIVTRPPGTKFLSSDTDDTLGYGAVVTYRVIAVRQGQENSSILIVSAEKW